MACCFNPSVGILCFRTSVRAVGGDDVVQFQSLGRDSVFSDHASRDYPIDDALFQSLGRDSVFSD